MVTMLAVDAQPTNDELREQKRQQLERIEISFYHWLGIATLFGLIVIPLIPASLTFMAIISVFPETLHIPQWIAWAIALFSAAGIEFLGLGAIKLALQMRKYNIVIEKAHLQFEHAPLRQGASVAFIYVGVVLALTFLLKMQPQLALWSLIPLALMGALVDWYFALKGDQEERESKLRMHFIAQDREQLQQREIDGLQSALDERTQQLAELQAQLMQQRNDAQMQLRDAQLQADELRDEIARLQSTVDALQSVEKQQSERTQSNDGDVMELNDTQVAAVRVIYHNPHIEQAAIANEIGKAASTVSRALSPLKRNGLIDETPDGWRVQPELVTQLNGAIAHG